MTIETIKKHFGNDHSSSGLGEYLKYAFYYAFAPHKPVVNMAGNPALIQDEADRMEAVSRGSDPLLVKYFSP